MAFSNSILAGEQLVRSGIRSPNYVPGVQGWRIAQDGSAEFNNVDIRGELQVNGSNGSVHIYDDPTNGAIVRFDDTGGGFWYLEAFMGGSTHELGIFGPNVGGVDEILMLFAADAGGSSVGIGTDIVRLAMAGTTFANIISASSTISAGSNISAGGSVTASSNIIASNDLRASHDIENFGAGQGVVVHSVNGSRWRMGVTNSGALSIAAA